MGALQRSSHATAREVAESSLPHTERPYLDRLARLTASSPSGTIPRRDVEVVH